ncbi:Rieske (2Fe-2S) protein [Streptomyces sp. ventii]|uniref:Cytochrome bc1 complex Rieske iron-sulfur subunit n=1 Tax=Streptomyces spiramenti TaxID=2720606 RepID=A0ABX1AJP1_9ACTN|nr:Rieske (2Fe-2S) protein [Streptomyces spiramenti]
MPPAAGGGTASTAPRGASRRTVLCGAALVSAGAVGLTATACGQEGGSQPAEGVAEPVQLGPAEDVPVGGTQLYRDEKVLVCRPEAGEYRAFSAVCPHAGCVLSGIRDEVAVCSCHGSTFEPATGEVLRGPAEEPLTPLELEIDAGDGLMVARPQS